MKQNLNQMAERFVCNVQDMKGAFVWHNAMVRRLAALLYAAEGRPVDGEAIRAAHALIKQNTGVFSSFRGNLVLCLAAMLSLAPGQERQMADTLAVYKMMKEHKFRASDYLVMAAYQIAAHAQEHEYPQVVARTRGFYEGMKARHFLLTGQDDYIFAAMLGLSDLEMESGVHQMEQLYQQLKPKFWSGNAVQTLAQILALCGDADGAAQRVQILRDAFRRADLRLDREYTLSSLGILAMLPAGSDEIVRDVGDTYRFLRAQKGFGAWSVMKQELLLLSAALTTFSSAGSAKDDVLRANLSTNITSIIIAQQAAIAVAAASSASAAASSSSN